MGTTDATWSDELLANPHAVADKRSRVQKMFAAIAPSYDINNRLHSLWMDQRWRREAVKLAKLEPTDVVLDVACGTGDLTLRFAEELDRLAIANDAYLGLLEAFLPERYEKLYAKEPFLSPRPLPGQLAGIDFTYEMLPLAREKSEIGNRKSQVIWINGDAQSLPLPDACCDVVSIAFGIRNVQDPAAAIREFRRVLRPGGRVIILEFSLPTNRLLRGLYNFYFRQILPRTATLISRDKTGAYKYLPESVNTFIGREQMIAMLRDAGFERVEQFPMTFGVCVCYRGMKLDDSQAS
jgi:demethylmenaquinone methyltransferase/2-methoxy-6-polyprenyl-1,4-benzoquinol methylase